MPPPRKEYPPLPDPGQPFDLSALERLDAELDTPTPPTKKWWRRRVPTARETGSVVVQRDPLALLALVPEPQLAAEIRRALRVAGMPYAVPVRVTLLTGLDARNVQVMNEVRAVARRHDPFRVRMVGPEVVQDRTVCLRVLGPGIAALQRDLHALFGANHSTADDPLNTGGSMLPLAGTWTEMNRVELHDVATGIRNELKMPVEFTASMIYAFDETVDEDVPFLDFPLGS